MRSAVERADRSEIEAIFRRLPPPQSLVFAPGEIGGIGQGTWRAGVTTELMCTKNFLGGGASEPLHDNEKLDIHIDYLKGVLERPHLRGLLEHFDDAAYEATQRVINTYARKVPAWWSDEWAVWVRAELRPGQMIVGSHGWYMHCIGIALERVDEQTVRYTTCNSGGGLPFHGARPPAAARPSSPPLTVAAPP